MHKRFQNEHAARRHLEAIRWPDGPYCPHCGSYRSSKIKSKSARPGLYFCGECRKQYTVTVGTLFERSKVPLHKWLYATHLLCASKKGISAHQLHRMLGVTYKTAWFMAHRIREAMRPATDEPFGGPGKTVEVDETFIGRDKTKKKTVGYQHKYKVLTLVDRDTGRARSTVVESLSIKSVVPILRQNITRESRILTDQAGYYRKLGDDFAKHESVNHEIGEYGRGDVHTNTIEGFFSIFKRGMKGVYQHCDKQHLHRYTAEFDFRYSHRAALEITDEQRTDKALAGITGKRLTYRSPDFRSGGQPSIQ